MGKFIDLTGRKFGKLTVIRRASNSPSNHTRWYCTCECNKDKEIIVDAYSLTHGITKSCGCYLIESAINNFKKANTYDLSGEYGIGYTSKGEEFYFDLEDYNKIKDYCWYFSHGYVCTNESKLNNKNHRQQIRMHVLLMGEIDGKCIDHINRNRNDNRKENLRFATVNLNTKNKSLESDNKSGVIGVRWEHKRNKWHSYINVNYKHKFLGYFDNIDDAIIERLKAEVKYYGEFAPQKHLFEKYNIKLEAK